MQQQGVITRWDDGRGFGFITQTTGGPDIFIHASAITRGPRPVVGDVVTFRTSHDDRNRLRATEVQYRESPQRRTPSTRGVRVAGLVAILFLGLLGVLAVLGFLPGLAVGCRCCSAERPSRCIGLTSPQQSGGRGGSASRRSRPCLCWAAGRVPSSRNRSTTTRRASSRSSWSSGSQSSSTAPHWPGWQSPDGVNSSSPSSPTTSSGAPQVRRRPASCGQSADGPPSAQPGSPLAPSRSWSGRSDAEAP